jgi:hypothetical protein
MSSPIDELAIVPWYRNEADYQAFRESADDSEDFFPTHAQWQSAAMEHEHRSNQYGVILVRATMDYQAYSLWIVSTGLRMNLESRNAFARQRIEKALA